MTLSAGTLENAKVAKLLKRVPLDRLLFETYSPCLTPVRLLAEAGVLTDPPQPNEPAFLPLIIREASRVLGRSEEELQRVTCGNAMRLLAGLDALGK